MKREKEKEKEKKGGFFKFASLNAINTHLHIKGGLILIETPTKTYYTHIKQPK